MPIVDIEVVEGGTVLPSGAAQRVADALGTTFGRAAPTVWVRLRTLPANRYAENGGAPPGAPPVFVDVMRADLPPATELAAEARAVAEAVATALGRPRERVHVAYEPPGRGRVAFGGRLLE